MPKVKRGFTLIELLIVMAIIAFMASIAIFALQSSQQRARDARRKADLELIRSGIELYRADCTTYPPSFSSGSSLIGPNPPPSACSSSNTYITVVPTDPLSGRLYFYNRLTSTTYAICASLEQAPNPAMNTSACGSCGTTCNYVVNSP